MAFCLKAAALASAMLVANAQDWGTVGAWEQVRPTTVGPPLAYRKPTHIAGSFVIVGNNTANGNTNAWIYDIMANTWTQWPDITGVAIQDPYTFSMGGYVVVIDELNFNNAAIIDASNPANGWSLPRLTGGPPQQRVGQRFLHWGATLYMWGGVEVNSGIYHNDMYACDLTAIIAGQPSAWVMVAADNTPGFPPARVGYSWTPFGIGAVMFGGVNVLPNAPAGTLPMACFDPSYAQFCEFHHNIWGFAPGNRGPPTPNSITGSAWVRFNEDGAYGGPVPTGRFDHTTAHMGDQLFVFGGTTATGTSAEMWVYNLVSQTWQQVTPSQPWPMPAQTDIGYGVGIGIGRHLYQYVQYVDQTGMPMPGFGQLWRWAPGASAGSTIIAPLNPPHPGAVAGIVIGILLGIANTALLVILGQNAGALPIFEGLACLSFGKKAPAPGFYSSVAASESSGGYVAPA